MYRTPERILGLLILIFLGFSNPADAASWKSWLGIHEKDDRDGVRFNDGWPWVAIGRLDNRSGGHCSGTLIERDRVLTAAHCVTDGDGGMANPSDLSFSAGFDQGKARATASVRRILTDPDLYLLSNGSPESIGLDWAVLELDRQLYDGGWLRPVPMASADIARRAASENWELAQAGYSGDQSQTLTRNQRCVPAGLAEMGRVMLHHCDATFGDSGSPILIYQNGEFSIAAVHVAFVRVDGDNFGAAVIPDRIPW